MSGVPTKRVLAYIAIGALVLAVGTLAIVSMRGGTQPAGEEGVVISQPGDSLIDAAAESPSTTTTTTPTIFVQVAGAVRQPGVYEMAPGSRVFQAIERAGGFDDGADREGVALAVELADGCRVYVPKQGESVPTSGAGISPSAQPGGSGSREPVSINSADLEALDSLPGVGPSTAQKIIDYREAKGPFTSIDQLADVAGIGPAKLEQIRPFVGL